MALCESGICVGRAVIAVVGVAFVVVVVVVVIVVVVEPLLAVMVVIVVTVVTTVVIAVACSASTEFDERMFIVASNGSASIRRVKPKNGNVGLPVDIHGHKSSFLSSAQFSSSIVVSDSSVPTSELS